MPVKFVVKKGTTGKFRFSLLSTTGNVVVTSDPYDTKAACMRGIAAVKKSAATAAVVDQTMPAAKAPAKAPAKGRARAAAKKTGARRAPAARAASKKAPSRKAPVRKAPARKAPTARKASRTR